MIIPSESAFPATIYFDETPIDCHPGLTKREYFAAMALQGLIAQAPGSIYVGRQAIQVHPDIAVQYADMLIAALNREVSE